MSRKDFDTALAAALNSRIAPPETYDIAYATEGDEAVRRLCYAAFVAANSRPLDAETIRGALRLALEALAERLGIDAARFEPRRIRTKADVHAVLTNAINLAGALSGGSVLEALQAFAVLFREV